MPNTPTIIEQVATALREHGWTDAITTALGLLAGTAAAVIRKALTNEAVLARLDRELATERQRAEDRESDAKRLDPYRGGCARHAQPALRGVPARPRRLSRPKK